MSRDTGANTACLRRSARRRLITLAERSCDLVLLLGAVALIVLAGCATPTRSVSAPAETPPAKPLPAEPTPIPLDEPHADRLTAVEDFLQRTQQYGSTSNNPAGPTRRAPAPPPSSDQQPPSSPIAKLDVAGAAAPDAGETKGVSVNAQMDVSPQDSSPKPALPAVERIAIRPVPSVIAPAEVTSNSTNVGMRAAADTQVGFDTWIAQLRSQATESPSFDAQLRLRLAYLAQDKDAEARDLPATIPAEERELLAELIEAAIAIRSLGRNPSATTDQAVERLESLTAALARRADPVVTGLAFCSKVSTFGVYDAMKDSDFVAGRSILTILYSELRNFRSELNAAGLYQTKLKTRVEIFSDAGQSIWSREEPEILDECRNRRRDFFVAQRLTIPPTLPAGDYVLKIYVEDVLAGRATEASKRFSIVAPVSVAKTEGR